MSTVKVEGNASGSGSVTLKSPNLSSDITVTLPDANGTVALTSELGGTPGMTLVQRTAITSATSLVAFTGFDDSIYDGYEFHFNAVTHNTSATPSFKCATSSNGGASYSIFYNSYLRFIKSNGSVSGVASNTVQSFNLCREVKAASTANEPQTGNGVNGKLYITAPELTGLRHGIHSTCITRYSSTLTTSELSTVHAMNYSGAPAINAMKFFFSSGSINGGVISMYGMNNS